MIADVPCSVEDTLPKPIFLLYNVGFWLIRSDCTEIDFIIKTRRTQRQYK